MENSNSFKVTQLEKFMEVVGVMHGYGDAFDNFSPVYPSDKIQEIIKELPAKTKVGIEIIPQTSDYLEFTSQLSNEGITQKAGEYFEEIEYICNQKGLKIIPLEDVDVEIEKLENYRRYTQSRDFGDFMEYFNSFFTKRENSQVKIIKENNPDIVFVGIAHATKWNFENTFKAKYHLELTDKLGSQTLYEGSPLFSKDIWQFGKGLEKLINLYLNKTLGNKIPDYTGTWNPNNLMGYFEIFLQNGKGTIEDFLGSASIEGIINKDKIDFTKQYDGEAVSSIKSKIQFTGANNEGLYSSDFGNGNFILSPPKDLFNKNQFHQVFEYFNQKLAEWGYDFDRLSELREKQPLPEKEHGEEDWTEEDMPF